MSRVLTVSCLLFVTLLYVSSRNLPFKFETPFNARNKFDWILQAQSKLQVKVNQSVNTRVAKNVILFIGDGMSMTTVAATRAYIGQHIGFLGEELRLSFELFTHTGLAKTYCVDRNVADCACSANACLTGVKNNYGTLGVSAGVKRGDCKAQRDGIHTVTGLMDWAQKAKKGTGIVTTARVTHATPAAAYAHSADANWEADTDLPKQGLRCDDIATQLVRGDVGSKIDVVLGGGRKYFFPKTQRDPEGHYGYRSDGTDLIKEWVIKKESYGAIPKYIYHKDALKNLDIGIYNSVLGLFSSDHMPYHFEGGDDDPSLTEMTEKAIQMLSKNKNGFVLLVEGGRIDSAHHETRARLALDETAAFARAVKTISSNVDFRETLIVVTSDHSHTMTYSGYSKRGTDILGLANMFNSSDNLPYSILSYANGPGYKPNENNLRHNLALDNMNRWNYTYPSLVPMVTETHGGEDVPVYAMGPWSHLFSGSYEQNFIPHAMAYASCIGPGITNCHL